MILRTAALPFFLVRPPTKKSPQLLSPVEVCSEVGESTRKVRVLSAFRNTEHVSCTSGPCLELFTSPKIRTGSSSTVQ